MTVIADPRRDELIRSLRQLEPKLRAKGVTHLAIFGSRARGDHRPDSDLDVLVEIDPHVKNRLYAAFDAQHIVKNALGLETQATVRSDLGRRVAERIADDLVEVF